jgi:hypothetical protein
VSAGKAFEVDEVVCVTLRGAESAQNVGDGLPELLRRSDAFRRPKIECGRQIKLEFGTAEGEA